MIYLIIAGAIVFVLAVCILAHATVDAYLTFKNAPREPMVWCHKHGQFRKGHCVPLGGILACPSCYAESLRDAKR